MELNVFTTSMLLDIAYYITVSPSWGPGEKFIWDRISEITGIALAGVAQWIECQHEQTKGSLLRFPVRAYARVAGQVPSRGHER